MTRILYFAICIISFLCAINNTWAQVFCPTNLDFETGMLSNWQFDTGRCCPITNMNTSGPLTGRHVLTSGVAVDQYGGFPTVAPGGGLYSLKLGNNSVGREAERARYSVQVPSTPGSYILTYRYAVVLQNPNHNAADQPRFEVKAIDAISGAVIACNNHSYISSSNLPGFQVSPISSQVYYRPWTTALLDLSGYTGQTVIVEFTAGDCAQGGHFGYGYIDMNCGLFQIYAADCNGASTITLNGPDGYQSYKWMDATLTSTIGTTQKLVLTKPSQPTTYAVVVTPYPGYGCADTFYTSYAASSITATASSDTITCPYQGVPLSVTHNSSNIPLTYQWWPSAGLSCAGCANPAAAPSSTTTYFVSVTDKYGCSDTDQVVVNTHPRPVANAGPDQFVCTNDTFALAGSGGISGLWFPSAGLTSPTGYNTSGSVTNTTTFNLAVTDGIGCRDTDKVVINTVKLVANAGLDTAVCMNDSISLKVNHNSAGPFTYLWYPAGGLSCTGCQTPKVSIPAGVLYSVVVEDKYGCIDTDQVQVNVKPLPTANAGPDQVFCGSGSFTLSGSGGQTYNWFPPTGLSDPTLPNPQGSTNSSKIFFLEVKNAQGCRDTDVVIINITPGPTADAGPDTSGCMNGIIELAGSSSGGGTNYYWYPVNNVFNPTSLTTKVKVTNNITYYFVVQDINGCSDTDAVNIVAYPNPVADAGEGRSLCFPDTVQLNGSPADTFLWTPTVDMKDWNTLNPKVYVGKNSPKVISFIVTNGYGCKDTATVTFAVAPDPLYDVTPKFAEGCIGSLVPLYASGGNYYKWTPANGLTSDSIANPLATLTGDMVYKVRIADICGRDSILEVTLKPKPSPKVRISKPHDIDCTHDQVELKAEGAIEYSWQPPNWLTDPRSANPVANPTERTVYTVTGKDKEGCIGIDTVAIDIIAEKQFFAPNAFTPDGDGRNDCYSLILPNDIADFEFNIFNRWGNNVYTTSDPFGCWDGKYKGAEQPVGTYYYFYKASSDECGDILEKGSIHLLK